MSKYPEPEEYKGMSMPMPMPGQVGAPSFTGMEPPPAYQHYPTAPGAVPITNAPGPTLMGPNIVTIQQSLPLGSESTHLICPHCRAEVTTQVEKSPSTTAWIISGVICLCGLWCGCCLIPLCIDDMKDSRHTCPNCNALLGQFRR